jgi:CelD/BcsL family acetyltransferase involved in cellulose biosynthesis
MFVSHPNTVENHSDTEDQGVWPSCQITLSASCKWSLWKTHMGMSQKACERLALDPAVMHIARTLDEFSALQSEWDELYSRSVPRNPFLSYAWTRACWDMQTSRLMPFVATIRENGSLVALAPFCIETRSGFRILRFIAEDRSDYLGVLCVPALKQVENQLLSELTARSTDWDLAVFRQIAEPFSSLHRVAPPANSRLYARQWTTSAYSRFDADWASLHSEGPAWLKEMRKRRRRFVREGGTIECFTGQDAVERLDQVASIEACSWKAREGVERIQAGAGQQLLRRAFAEMEPELHLWIGFVSDRAVAFQIGFVAADRLWLYQASYDERFSKERAGSVVSYVAIEQCWERGIREYDYMAGEEPYKLARTSRLRPIYSVAVHRRTVRGWLAYAILIAPRWTLRDIALLRRIHRWVKELRRRSPPVV